MSLALLGLEESTHWDGSAHFDSQYMCYYYLGKRLKKMGHQTEKCEEAVFGIIVCGRPGLTLDLGAFRPDCLASPPSVPAALSAPVLGPDCAFRGVRERWPFPILSLPVHEVPGPSGGLGSTTVDVILQFML